MDTNQIYKAILGEKKCEIIEFIAQNCNEFGFFNYTIKDVCENLRISKPTAIATFSLLEEKNVLRKIKNGVYKMMIGKNDE